MKKWSLILWFAAIVGAAFIFTACDGDDSDDEGDAFTDVTGDYILKGGEASTTADESGVSIASALKSNSTGDITIVLTGKVKADYLAVATKSPYADAGSKSTVTLGGSLGVDWTDAVWGTASALTGAEPGVYGAVYIDGLITLPIVNAGTIAIKQTNEALRLYAGVTDLVDDKPDAPLVPSVPWTGNIWIPDVGVDDTPLKWKAYVDATSKAPNLATGPFGVLLWDGGTEIPPYSNKIATLEVETVTIDEGGTTATQKDLLARYIIDYSGVEFDITASYRLADEDGGVTVIGNSTNLNAAAAQTTDANGKPVITVTLTPKSGALTGKYDFGSTNALWGGKASSAPNDWKYADISVNVGKLFADLDPANTILSFKSTSQAYRYYKGAGDILTGPPAYPRNTQGSNIYIPDDNSLPVKWRVYDKGTFDISTTFGIILAQNASPKVTTVEIYTHGATYNTAEAVTTAHDTGTLVKTLKIDYSAVTINSTQ
jgi:hypothetical protein